MSLERGFIPSPRHPERSEGSKVSFTCAVTLGSFAALRMTVAGVVFLSLISLARAAEPTLAPADLQFFDTKIRPVLTEQCYKCHSHTADKVKGGLMLDSRDALFAGGSSGRAIVPGKPDDSLLIQAIRYTDADLRMPPAEHGGKLTEQQIGDWPHFASLTAGTSGFFTGWKAQWALPTPP